VQAQGMYFEGDHIVVDDKIKQNFIWNQFHLFIFQPHRPISKNASRHEWDCNF
jgi:lipopolysaccharide assembly outer membrane protein LptD (OstA)